MPTFEPVDFDPFAASSIDNGRLNSVRIQPAGQPRYEPVDHDPFGKPGVVEDMARALPSGVAKGAIGLAALPETISQLWAAGGDKATEALASVLGLPPEWAEQTKQAIAAGRKQGAMQGLPTQKGMTEAVEGVTGKLYEPQTVPGHYAQTIGEFAPAAIGGPASIAGKVANVAVPAIASETAGQVTKGTAAEPYARFGAALAGGIGAGLATRPGNTARTLRNQLPDDITPQMFDRAEALMQHSATIGGPPLSWPEALSQVAGRPILTETLRHLEASPETANRMAAFFGQRPQQIENAARNQFDTLAPVNTAPSNIGAAVGGAGEDIATAIRSAINTATRPMYDAAGQHLVPRQVHAQMMSDPRFAQAIEQVRNDPHLNSFVRGHSDRSVAMYDAAKKQLEQQAQNAAQPLNPNASQAVASSAGTMADTTRRVAIAAERQSAGGPSSYEAALAAQARLREQYLTPFLNSPLGKAAGRDTTTKQAIEALFPANPVANSEHEIGQAVRALAGRNRRAAEDLTRAYVESVFNKTAKDLQTGPNQAGGAKFRAALIGDSQEARNLEAAVTALHGPQVWQGFNRFMEVMEATGARQGIGSKTSYNDAFRQNASAGGFVRDATKVTANPAKLLQPLAERYDRFMLDRNLNQIAGVLTNPRSGNMLRAIANMPARSAAASTMALKLITYGDASK